MRKVLTHLLMLLMLLPGLACGPIMHAAKAEVAQPSMQGMKDCPEMAGMKQAKKASDNKGPMLFKDCLNVDLQDADHHANLKAPDLSSKVFFTAWAATVPDYIIPLAEANAIRGPPPDWPGLSRTQPSILLITQRLRV